MQAEVLEKIGSEDLATYVVWEPIMKTDGKLPARRATTLVPDRRALHFWTEATVVGRAFQRALRLDGEPAWDVYLLYPPGVDWKSSDAPSPTFFMHQLRGRLPDSLLLDGSVLAERTRRAMVRAGTKSGR